MNGQTRKLMKLLRDLEVRLVAARRREVATANRYYALERIDGVMATLVEVETALSRVPVDVSLQFSLGRGMSEWNNDDRAIALGYEIDKHYSDLYRVAG